MMPEEIYKELEKDLTTRDLLAIERNNLANERTLLAYMRTFLSFFVAGISLIQFFQYKLVVILGYSFIPVGWFFLIAGLIRYFSAKRIISKIKNQ